MVADYATLWPFFSLALQIVEQQPEGEAMVQVLAEWPRSLVLILDRDGVSNTDLPVTDRQISVLVGLLRRGMETVREGRAPGFQAGVASQLFTSLFGSRRDGLMSHERLIVSTSGALQSLSLELLAVGAPTGDWQAGDHPGAVARGAARRQLRPQPAQSGGYPRARAGSSHAEGMAAIFADSRSGVGPRKVLAVPHLPETCLRLTQAIDRVGELPGRPPRRRSSPASSGTRRGSRPGPSSTRTR